MKEHKSLTSSQQGTADEEFDETMVITASASSQASGAARLQRQNPEHYTGRVLGLTGMMQEIVRNYERALGEFQATVLLPDPERCITPDAWAVLQDWIVTRTREDLTAGLLQAADAYSKLPISGMAQAGGAIATGLSAQRAAAASAQGEWALADFISQIRRHLSDQATALAISAVAWGEQLDRAAATATDAEIALIDSYLSSERDRLQDVLTVEHNFDRAYMALVGQWITSQGGEVDIVLRGPSLEFSGAHVGVEGGASLLRRADGFGELYTNLDIPLKVRWFPHGDLACIEGTRHPDGSVTIEATTMFITAADREAFLARVADPLTLCGACQEEE